MYNEYFGLTDRPFSIAPDPRYLYMSEQHKEALAHLMYGVRQEGGFILLTGEVGTGKTTVCRCFLKQLDDSIDVAYIVNPKQTSIELLETMCDDLSIPRFQDEHSIKSLTDVITERLLTNHAKGKSTVLLIDEAQNLSVEVLEQLRLLTNLETDQKKLLQIILLGQPELLDILAKPELRQLSQRVTARFHMAKLDRKDIIPYVQHRLAVAGCRMSLFPESTSRVIEKASGGVPRLINLICDRALLGVYSTNGSTVTTQTLKQAANEVLGEQRASSKGNVLPLDKLWLLGGAALVVQVAILFIWLSLSSSSDLNRTPESATLLDVDSADSNVSSSTLNADEVGKEEAPIESADDKLVDLNDFFNPSAFLNLTKAWGVGGLSPNKQQLCDELTNTLLRCESNNASWSRLIRINRPSVASAYYQGQLRYLFIDGLIQENETIKLKVVDEDGQSRFMDQSLFERLWTGQLDYLWLEPYKDMPLLKPGDVHDYIEAIRYLLTGESGGPVYDDGLYQAVRSFQSDMGVVSDGVIGPKTIMLFNEISGQSPVLQSLRHSSLVQARSEEQINAFSEEDKLLEAIESMEHQSNPTLSEPSRSVPEISIPDHTKLAPELSDTGAQG